LQLELLDVRDNFIHKDTTIHLCELIVNAKKLKSLNISDSNLECSQNEAILDALDVK